MKVYAGPELRLRTLAAAVDRALGYPRPGVHVGGGRHVELGDSPGPGWTITAAEPDQAPDGKWEYPEAAVLEAIALGAPVPVVALAKRERVPRPESLPADERPR